MSVICIRVSTIIACLSWWCVLDWIDFSTVPNVCPIVCCEITFTCFQNVIYILLLYNWQCVPFSPATNISGFPETSTSSSPNCSLLLLAARADVRAIAKLVRSASVRSWSNITRCVTPTLDLLQRHASVDMKAKSGGAVLERRTLKQKIWTLYCLLIHTHG